MRQERDGLAGARARAEGAARGSGAGAGRDGSPPLYSEVGSAGGGGGELRPGGGSFKGVEGATLLYSGDVFSSCRFFFFFLYLGSQRPRAEIGIGRRGLRPSGGQAFWP